jgi:enolase
LDIDLFDFRSTTLNSIAMTTTILLSNTATGITASKAGAAAKNIPLYAHYAHYAGNKE